VSFCPGVAAPTQDLIVDPSPSPGGRRGRPGRNRYRHWARSRLPATPAAIADLADTAKVMEVQVLSHVMRSRLLAKVGWSQPHRGSEAIAGRARRNERAEPPAIARSTSSTQDFRRPRQSRLMRDQSLPRGVDLGYAPRRVASKSRSAPC